MIHKKSMKQNLSQTGNLYDLVKRMELVIEFSTDGIYVVDHKGVTIMVNSAYEEITGLNRDDLIGHHMAELMQKGYIDESVSLIVLEKKECVSMMQKIDGKKDVMVTGNPVFDDAGEIVMVVTSVRDITHLNQLKNELLKAKSFSKLNNYRYTLELDGSEHTLILRSQKMKQIYEKIQQIAPYPTSILLSGPSGVGKEIIGNLIHYFSDRKNQPFIKVNCGAIPEQLLESELFGYEKGAFTGARQEGKIGLLELAHGGTIMLDEIGEMPIFLQVKLLRVLQDKQILRIGGYKPIKLDIRIISATNQNLRKLIQEGTFREDLYYRLQVVEIRVPPLVERQEDIEELITHFFSYYCRLYHLEKEISAATIDLLKSYHWPGNVRELRNLIENMIVSVPSIIIEPHHLPPHIYDFTDSFPSLTLKMRMEQYEKRIIKEALEQNPSVRQAARQLGVDHSTLIKKLKKWGTL